jgi:hypothetical protein
MSNLEKIYNNNYGVSAATNGNFIAIGNPPNKLYDECEGINRIGQVYLLQRQNIGTNYETVKILRKNQNNSVGKRLITYFTEQSSSTTFTASFTIEKGSKQSTQSTCSYIGLEENNAAFNSSNFGISVDLSDYFLAVGDTNVIENIYDVETITYSSVDIFKVNPNYSYGLNGIVANSSIDGESLNEYNVSNIPMFVITGSSIEKFGSSVSITNNYLAVGATGYNGGRGCVYIYKINQDDVYELQSIVTASISQYPNLYGFGHSVCIDKKNEDKIIVGTNQLSDAYTFLYFSSASINWKLNQVFSQNTGSSFCKLDDGNFTFVQSGSQNNNHFGYSVAIYDKNLAIGAPNDLLYWEYSGSNLVRQRGSVYVYTTELCTPSDNYEFLTKLYGDSNTLKDNLFGYSVSLFNDKLLIGSPKPYFPFGSWFISSSINFYDKSFTKDDGGESTYCGQSLLYEISKSQITQLTSQPIGKRKEFGKPYNAFGYAVSLSDTNLVIGAPIPLVNDFYLSGLSLTESGSGLISSYIPTSSFQSEICEIPSSFVLFETEDSFSCAASGACDLTVVFSDEIGDYETTSDKVLGKGYIYELSDLKTNYDIGNVFYNNNKLVINTTGSILSNLTLDPENYNNSYLFMNYKSELNLFEKQYICTIEPGEFNVSTNPTAITSSLFDYGVINTQTFDFNNLDIILRYMNYKLTSNSSEKWWTNFVSGDYEESVFNFYSSSIVDYNENKLTNHLRNKCGELNLDINDDGIANTQDASMLWKYFIQNLTPNNFTNYLNPRCKRNNFNDIFSFLNEKTGKFNTIKQKSTFLDYNYSSSLDPTGSYLAPYITTVGLYNGADLVAIAKLAQPIKNTGEIPINIVVKWDV